MAAQNSQKEKAGKPSRNFLFFENAIRDATAGCMGNRDEVSVDNVKILEENQTENFEDNQ